MWRTVSFDGKLCLSRWLSAMSFSQLCRAHAPDRQCGVVGFILPLSKHLFLQITPVVLQRLAKLLNDDDVPPGYGVIGVGKVHSLLYTFRALSKFKPQLYQMDSIASFWSVSVRSFLLISTQAYHNTLCWSHIRANFECPKNPRKSAVAANPKRPA